MTAVYPLSADGAAANACGMLGETAGVVLNDRTAWPRFGLKGPGADDWFKARFSLPEVNQWIRVGDVLLLRLGSRDIVVLAADGDTRAIGGLREEWTKAPQGYASYREEVWAWLNVSGPEADAAIARLTAFDMRKAAFGEHAVAQTRFAHQDCVMIRSGQGYDILFDVASTAQVVTDIHAAARRREAFA